MADARQAGEESFDAIVVGAGFAGMVMLYRLRELGLRARVYETGDGVGGTWYWNRYPGARCDIESMEYSYQFSEELQQEWEWSERYATQPEILRYANHVADRFDLRSDIQFETRVESARFDESADSWHVTTSRGAATARYLIMATGCLSSVNTPTFEGLEDFGGDWVHTGQWPHEGVDFSGKRVAVIGTGSSGIQSIPLIAEQASHLTVFQRTANFSVPAYNGPLDPEHVAAIKADYPGFRAQAAMQPSGANFDYTDTECLAYSDEEVEAMFEERWKVGGLGFLATFNDLGISREANEKAADFFRRKIREIVDDPKTAEALCPDETQVVGCKRLCVDTDYYATFNRDNVELVDVSKTPIERIGEKGVVVAGREVEVDLLVLATGFDAMTGALLAVDIRGRGARSLREAWAEGPRTYLGVGTAGFPNLFIITGPGSPSVLSNMLPSIEQNVNWIADCLAYLGERGHTCIEVTEPAQKGWVDHVNEVADLTLFPTCNSWYLGANVPGKPRVFMPYIGFPTYVALCDAVAAKDYEGFAFR